MSYDERERIDIGLVERTIKRVGLYRTPVPQLIEDSVLIHGAMDNFDHEENTKSGIGGSHDTILMLFQNNKAGMNNLYSEVNEMPDNFSPKNRSLEHILECQ